MSNAQDPNILSDPHAPLRNLAQIRTRLDSLHQFISQSVTTNSPLSHHQSASVSDQIAAAIHHTIANANALLSHSRTFPPPSVDLSDNAKHSTDLKIEPRDDDDDGNTADDEEGGDGEIVELDAVELLAEHIHFCEICGKGFRRDANLRMHMRAHGNQFKTPEALAKPGSSVSVAGGGAAVRSRFSCPFEGCNRNKQHQRFRPLKSIVCVKNHFKRSHCPKMYSCTRCHKKNFSVLSDLKSHMKHCGESSRWRCSCGTTFSRKDKLFGHIALFEGHMPLLAAEEDEKGKQRVPPPPPAEGEEEEDNALPDAFFDDLDDLNCFGFPVI